MPKTNASRTLAPDVAERLAKLLGMLGSDQPGERAAAALKADELLKREGLSWFDVIAVESESETDWRTMVRVCMAQAAALSGKELQFVRTMARWRGQPSEKQFEWLEGIYARIGGDR